MHERVEEVEAHHLLGREPVRGAELGQQHRPAVLSALESGPAQTQSQLAGAVGRDKTRLIPILDRLEQRDLLHRTPDPADRRNRVVTLTDDGRAVLGSCRAAIRRLEASLLTELAPAERAVFIAMLERLAASVGRM